MKARIEKQAALLQTKAAAPSPDRVALPLPRTNDFIESIMLRATFAQHFDAVVLDFTYVERRSPLDLQREGRWAFVRNISILIDFTSGLNLYPDLRLCNNSAQYENSVQRIQRILRKIGILVNASSATINQTFSSDVIVAGHRAPGKEIRACDLCYFVVVAVSRSLPLLHST